MNMYSIEPLDENRTHKPGAENRVTAKYVEGPVKSRYLKVT